MDNELTLHRNGTASYRDINAPFDAPRVTMPWYDIATKRIAFASGQEKDRFVRWKRARVLEHIRMHEMVRCTEGRHAGLTAQVTATHPKTGELTLSLVERNDHGGQNWKTISVRVYADTIELD